MTRGPSRRAQQPPLFLLGAARSGTSLLYKAMCLHPEAAWISNYLRRAPRLTLLAAVNRLAAKRPDLQERVWFADGNAYVYGRPRTRRERMFPMPAEGEPLFRVCGVSEHPASPSPAEVARQQACLRRAFDALRRWSGGRQVVSKRIANNWRIPLLAGAFPDARYVDLLRDGRAVASSLRAVDWWEGHTVWWYGGRPADWVAAGGDPWDLCGLNWVKEVQAIEAGLTAVPEHQVLHLTYEDFIRRPVDTMVEVAEFSGLGADPTWVARLRTLDFPDKNDAWRSTLPADAVTTIEAAQAEELRARGYV